MDEEHAVKVLMALTDAADYGASDLLTAHLLARRTGVRFLSLTGVKEMGDLTLLDEMERARLIVRVEEGYVYRYRLAGRSDFHDWAIEKAGGSYVDPTTARSMWEREMHDLVRRAI